MEIKSRLTKKSVCKFDYATGLVFNNVLKKKKIYFRDYATGYDCSICDDKMFKIEIVKTSVWIFI